MDGVLIAGLTRRPPTSEQKSEAARGREFARAWREQAKPVLDAIYGPDRPPAGALLGQAEEARRGREFAARWRREQPYRALLDSLYGGRTPR